MAHKVTIFLSWLCSLNSYNIQSIVPCIYLLLQETQLAKIKGVNKSFVKNFGCVLCTMLHQQSSGPLLEFCVCSHSSSYREIKNQQNCKHYNTHTHFSKCYFSRKREKFRGPLYFCVTNNYINSVSIVSLGHRLRVTDILFVFYQYWDT